MSTAPFDVEAAMAEAIAKNEKQQAALRIREQTFDLQFEPYQDESPNGAGQTWMTELQLERAALRLCMKTRLVDKTRDVRKGQSDPGTDAALVAQAYLETTRSNREAMRIIHDAAEHLKTNPPLYRPDPAKLRVGPSIQLASGAYFDFLDPDSTPLSIQDIAAGLSRICRYTGQLAIGEDEIYTVGQHSVLASENCDEDCNPFEALMHDRAEGVMNDMASPLKQLLPCYKEIEVRVETSTAIYYGLPEDMTDGCKRIDIRMLATEKRDLMPVDTTDDGQWKIIEGVEPLPFRITCWGPRETRWRFLHRYYYLTEGRIPSPDEPYALPHPNAPAAYVAEVKKAWGDRWVDGGMGMPTTVAA